MEIFLSSADQHYKRNSFKRYKGSPKTLMEGLNEKSVGGQCSLELSLTNLELQKFKSSSRQTRRNMQAPSNFVSRAPQSASGLIVCKGAPFKERHHPEDMNFFTRKTKRGNSKQYTICSSELRVVEKRYTSKIVV